MAYGTMTEFPGDQFQSKHRKQKGTFLQEPCLIPWGPNAAVLARYGGLERATSASCVRLGRSDGKSGGRGREFNRRSQLPNDSLSQIFFFFYYQWSWFEWFIPPRNVQHSVSLVSHSMTTKTQILLRHATPVPVVKMKSVTPLLHVVEGATKNYCKQTQGAARMTRVSLDGRRISCELLFSISKNCRCLKKKKTKRWHCLNRKWMEDKNLEQC